MTVSVKVGSFNSGTGAVDSTIVVNDVGFQPRLLIFWWGHGVQDAVSIGNVAPGYGFAASPTDRFCHAAFSDDGLATQSACVHGYRTDACIITHNTALTHEGYLDLQFLDANGFTLVVRDPFTFSFPINYAAIGGSDISNVKTGTFLEPLSTGLTPYTGVGFQSDFMLFVPLYSLAAPPANASGAMLGLGAAARPGGVTKQACMSISSRQAVNPTVTRRYCRSGECLASMIVTGAGSVNARASLNSFDSDGWTLDWLQRTDTDRRYGYVAVKGGKWNVDSIQTWTDVLNHSKTGIGFQPKLIMPFGVGNFENTAGASSAHAAMSFGAAESAVVYRSAGMIDQDAVATTRGVRQIISSGMYAVPFTSGGVGAELYLVSFDADGFTYAENIADNGAKFVPVIALGDGVAAPPPVGEGINTGGNVFAKWFSAFRGW